METKITVGLTCFNACDTIESALNSIADQNYKNIQIIVVDDASIDNSAEIIKNFIINRSELNVLFYRKEINEGYAAALNTIIEAAEGIFIAFFDDDDISNPMRLSEQVSRITSYEQAKETASVLCYTNRLIVREGQSAASHVSYAIGRQPVEPFGTDVADFIFWSRGARGFCWGMFGSCTLMARTELLKGLGGFDPAFRRCAEWDLAARHAISNGHFVSVDSPLVTQRKTASSDKAGQIPLIYALRLRTKHKKWLKSRRTYWGSRLVARSRHYGARGRKNSARAVYLAATLLSPAIFRDRLAGSK